MPAIAGTELIGFSIGYKFWLLKDLDIEKTITQGTPINFSFKRNSIREVDYYSVIGVCSKSI